MKKKQDNKHDWWPVVWTILRYAITAILGYLTGDGTI